MNAMRAAATPEIKEQMEAEKQQKQQEKMKKDNLEDKALQKYLDAVQSPIDSFGVAQPS